MNNNSFDELILKLSKSENDLKIANDTIITLTNELRNKVPSKYFEIFEENNILEMTHKLCEEDILNSKNEIKNLTDQQKKNEAELLKLKEENSKLKKNKSPNISKKESQAYKNLVNNLKDLSKLLGIGIRKNDSKEKNDDNKAINENKIINNDTINKKKETFEKKITYLKDKSNRFSEVIEDEKKIIDEYKDYLNEINQLNNSFKEKINISVISSIQINNNKTEKQFTEINNQIDIASKSLVELDEIIFDIKNSFISKIENCLIKAQENLNNLSKEENKKENNFNNICENINKIINEIEKIFDDFEKNRESFYSKNEHIKEEMNKLKDLHKQFTDEYKNKREMNKSIIKQSIMNPSINSSVINNNSIQNSSINNNVNPNRSIIQKKNLAESFLFKVKEPKSKADLYKTINLFKENEQDLLEMYLDEAQLLRKNYHVMCYVYDDYDLYDIYYDLKGVGLGDYEFFPKCVHPFYYDEIIEIESFSIDGIASQYNMIGHGIEFNINLRNFESIKVHIVYKSRKDLSKLSNGEIDERSIYRSDYYGLDNSLAGQMAKFSLILKGSFDIVNFSEYFLIRNTNNTNEIEYFWGGRVPYEGRRTLIMFSKKEAIWSFCNKAKFHSNNFLRNTNFYLPIEFIGGNNEILNIAPTSPQSTNIILDEENRQYIVEYINTYYKQAEFMIKGELRNKCKGEWEVDLTDEQVESKMPPEDVLCKPQLQTIAKKIIEDFDKNNKESDFEFLDFMKIGMWVKKNIKYDLNYTGKTNYSAIDIYNNRAGVCHHFTRLSNALLYSLGYKVIYASGYACQKNKIFKTDTGHAWSLIRLDNRKWYPFDSTWGIFTGKLPVGHIFATFFAKTSRLWGYDQVHFDEGEMEGKFIK